MAVQNSKWFFTSRNARNSGWNSSIEVGSYSIPYIRAQAVEKTLQKQKAVSFINYEGSYFQHLGHISYIGIECREINLDFPLYKKR
jgi:hypothetical protein